MPAKIRHEGGRRVVDVNLPPDEIHVHRKGTHVRVHEPEVTVSGNEGNTIDVPIKLNISPEVNVREANVRGGGRGGHGEGHGGGHEEDHSKWPKVECDLEMPGWESIASHHVTEYTPDTVMHAFNMGLQTERNQVRITIRRCANTMGLEDGLINELLQRPGSERHLGEILKEHEGYRNKVRAERGGAVKAFFGTLIRPWLWFEPRQYFFRRKEFSERVQARDRVKALGRALENWHGLIALQRHLAGQVNPLKQRLDAMQAQGQVNADVVRGFYDAIEGPLKKHRTTFWKMILHDSDLKKVLTAKDLRAMKGALRHKSDFEVARGLLTN